MFIKLRPSSVLIFSSVGVGIISNGAPSRALNIGVDWRVSSVWIGGGLGVNRGQSDASSSYKYACMRQNSQNESCVTEKYHLFLFDMIMLYYCIFF